MTDELNLLSAKEAAGIMNVSPATFNRWRSEGLGPVGKVIGKSTWWTRKDIADWEANLAKENQLNPALR